MESPPVYSARIAKARHWLSWSGCLAMISMVIALLFIFAFVLNLIDLADIIINGPDPGDERLRSHLSFETVAMIVAAFLYAPLIGIPAIRVLYDHRRDPINHPLDVQKTQPYFNVGCAFVLFITGIEQLVSLMVTIGHVVTALLDLLKSLGTLLIAWGMLAEMKYSVWQHWQAQPHKKKGKKKKKRDSPDAF